MNRFPTRLGLFMLLVVFSLPVGQAEEHRPAWADHDPSGLVRFKTPAEAERRRQELIRFIWPDGLPETRPAADRDIAFPPALGGIARGMVSRVDRLEADIGGTGFRAVTYEIHPVRGAVPARLALVHAGHVPDGPGHYLSGGLSDAIHHLLRRGHIVAVMQMPVTGWNTDTDGAVNANVDSDANAGAGASVGARTVVRFEIEKRGTAGHREMFAELEPLMGGRVFSFFLEPIVQSVNAFVARHPDRGGIAMIGLSGGGWTTHMAAAIDRRIQLSIPVAGAMPLYAREFSHGSRGDSEQSYVPLYREIASDGQPDSIADTADGVASWLEIFALGAMDGATGRRREQVQVLNYYDPCCFRGDVYRSYDEFLSRSVEAISGGQGRFRVVSDRSHQSHVISGFTLDTVLDPALGGVESPSPGAARSALWGRRGETWREDGRLPDFSFAGYRRDERSATGAGNEISVRMFGAVGDGEADDTEAFRKGLAAARGGILRVPPGRFKITDMLTIRDSGTVIRGAGPEQSILFFPIPLNDIHPNWGATTGGRRTSNYSWSGGFIRVAGRFQNEPVARVTEEAVRGDRSLVLSGLTPLSAGDELVLRMRDTSENSLAVHLYAGDPGRIEKLNGRCRESFLFQVTAVDPARGRIELNRPLRTDVRLEWKPALFRAVSVVERVGIEDLGFHFPNTAYRGHFTELGFNAATLVNARRCWIRHVRIHNADSGIFVSGMQNSLENILLTSDRAPEPSRRATGHHGVTLGGQDNLLDGFEIRTRFMHDITVTRGSAGNVISDGSGVDLALDHHRHGPHSNLFTDLDLGAGTRMFQSGGGADLGRHSGAFETFWNIRAREPQSWPEGWGPDAMNFIGVHGMTRAVTDPAGRWIEAIAPESLEPQNLFRSQQTRRWKSR